MPKRQRAAELDGGGLETNSEASSDSARASGGQGGDVMTKAVTVGVIGVGVALFEAALIPGMIVGAAAMLAPNALGKVGRAARPVFRTAVRGVYTVGRKTRHAVAEAQEKMRDIVTEATAETTRPTAQP